MLVIGYFMHLKFDNGRFSRVFALGAIGAFTLYAVVLLMFRVWSYLTRCRAFNPHIDVWLILGSVVAAYLIWARRHERDTGEVTDAARPAVVPRRDGGAVRRGRCGRCTTSPSAPGTRAHMVQHLLYTLVAAPMLVPGSPRGCGGGPRAGVGGAAWRTITRPVVAP